jgi:hypothetical protein
MLNYDKQLRDTPPMRNETCPRSLAIGLSLPYNSSYLLREINSWNVKKIITLKTAPVHTLLVHEKAIAVLAWSTI